MQQTEFYDELLKRIDIILELFKQAMPQGTAITSEKENEARLLRAEADILESQVRITRLKAEL